MERLNFINIYLERLKQIDNQLKEIDVNKNYNEYSQLLNEKRCIEDYLKDKQVNKGK